jgi:SAM-dependent methyltransferase
VNAVRSASRSYGRIANRYEQARGGSARAEQIHRALAPWLPTAGVLCDVGVGTGIIADRIAVDGVRVVGVDVSVEMLQVARTRLPGRVAVADGAALPLRTASVDAVLFVWVLHHVGDLRAALREAARVVRDGGRVVAMSGYAAPVDDDVDPIFRRLDESLRPERLTHSDDVSAAAVDAGLQLVGAQDAVVTFETSPNELAGAIEERMYAPLWDLDENRWASTVVPAINDLRALPEPDRARHREPRHPMWVWQRGQVRAGACPGS